MTDTTPPMGAETRAEKALQRQENKTFRTIILYAGAFFGLGGTTLSGYAHSRVSDEHDKNVITAQMVVELKTQMDEETAERKAHDIRTDDKLDRLLQLLYDRQSRLEVSK